MVHCPCPIGQKLLVCNTRLKTAGSIIIEFVRVKIERFNKKLDASKKHPVCFK